MATNSTDFFRAKHTRTEGYTAAQALVLESQIRERSFWSSGVKNAQMLLGMRECCDGVISGELSKEEALMKMFDVVKASGYVSPKGKEGGLHDLLSDRRQRIIIDTNVEMVQGYMRKAEALENLEIFPCQELVRGRRSRVERPWRQIWTAAGGKLYGGRMIARIDAEIWRKINDFGNDYPPFKWGSGMTVEHIDRDEAVELGVIKPTELVEEAAQAARNNATIESINSDIEANFEKFANKSDTQSGGQIKGLSEDTKRFVAKVMHDKGVWKGDKYVCADSNGTAKYYPKDLAVVVSLDKSKNSQYSSAIKWFTKKGENGYKFIQSNPESAEALHFGNLVRRTIPMTSETPLYRGLHFDSKRDFDAFCAKVQNGSYMPLHTFESFTKDRKFADRISDKYNFKVVLVVRKHSQFADISPIAEYFHAETAKEFEAIPQVRKNLKYVRTIKLTENYFEAEVEQ